MKMAGQITDVLEEQALIPVRTEMFTIPSAGSVTAVLLGFVSRRTAVNSVKIMHGTVPGGTLTVKVTRTPAGAALPTDSTDIAGSYALTSGDDMSTSTRNTERTLTLTTSRGVPTQNILEAGDGMWLVSSGNLSGLGQIALSVRMTEIIK